MINMSKANTARVVALAAIAVVAMFTFAGAAYAYTATYTDSFTGQETDEEYVIVTGNEFTLTAQTISAVWNSATTTTGTGATFAKVTAYSGGHFVKDIGTVNGETVTSVEYDLGVITVTQFNDTNPTGVAVSGLASSAFTCTPTKAAIGTGLTDATDTMTVAVTETATPGTYKVSITYNLIALEDDTASEDIGKEYIIPGCELTVSYEVKEKITA